MPISGPNDLCYAGLSRCGDDLRNAVANQFVVLNNGHDISPISVFRYFGIILIILWEFYSNKYWKQVSGKKYDEQNQLSFIFVH